MISVKSNLSFLKRKKKQNITARAENVSFYCIGMDAPFVLGNCILSPADHLLVNVHEFNQ